jgi:hypothetical protein
VPGSPRSVGVIATVLVLAVLAGHAVGDGVVVRVPRAPGQVYVPVDVSGQHVTAPVLPAPPPVPPPPVIPPPPAAPSPPAPSIAPLPPGWALLTVEVEPVNADGFVDGEAVGPIAAGIGAGRTIAVAPGFHRVDLVAPGFRPATTSVALISGRRITVRLALEAEGPGALEGGYYVLPRARPAPVPPRSGGGYFVVPAP